MVLGQLGRDIVVQIKGQSELNYGKKIFELYLQFLCLYHCFYCADHLDYAFFNHSRLTFSPNVSSHSVLIKIFDDNVFEKDEETLSFTLSVPSSYRSFVNITTSLALVHIKDDESE